MVRDGKNTSGGSSADRRYLRRHNGAKAIPDRAGEITNTSASRAKRNREIDSAQGRSEMLSLLGIGLTLVCSASTTLPWQLNPWAASLLFCIATIIVLVAVWRVWRFGTIWFAFPALLVILAFGWLELFGVVKPQRSKPFKDLLLEGYHLTNECEEIPADTEMPIWMRDQSKGWQARVQQLIADRLNTTDAQMWQESIIIGTVKDEATNGYQCLWLSNKVSALETIIAADFEPNLKHRNDLGPTYWLNAVNGEVDLTDVFKIGLPNAHVYINGGGKSAIKVKGHTPFPNASVKFQLESPP